MTHMGDREGPRLLVVDDNRDAADSLAVLLGLWGYRPRVAYDGPTALALAGAEQPDGILLDLGMPGMDGFQLAGALRGRPDGAGVPLVALTGHCGPAYRARARAVGFDQFLIKPVHPDRLQRVLGDLLRVRLLAVRLDGLARRHAQLADEAAGLMDDARRHTQALRLALTAPAAD